jgi:tyrosine decarboxylase/aspartate 1-decarboxylase
MTTPQPSSASRASDRMAGMVAQGSLPRPAQRGLPMRLDAEGMPSQRVQLELTQLCADDHDYGDRSVFNSICSSPLPLAMTVFAAHLETNGGDNRIFPSAQRAQESVTAMLGDLFDLPAAFGVATSGGTEANLLAVYAAVRRWQQRNRTDRRAPVLVADNAHFSFDKIVRLLPVERVALPVGADHRVDPARVAGLVTGDAALLVLTAGTSETGAVDEIAPLAEVAARLGVPVHIDAATGGFLVPFAETLPYLGFAIPGVSSITVDPHKYGGAPIAAGYLLQRHESDHEALRVRSHYHGTTDHLGLLGTRSGGPLLATYAALRHLGRHGYQQRASHLFALRDHLIEELGRAGLPPAYQPDLTVVGFAHPDPSGLQEALQRRGLITSVAHRLDLVRLVVHTHHQAADLSHLVATIVEVDALGGD